MWWPRELSATMRGFLPFKIAGIIRPGRTTAISRRDGARTAGRRRRPATCGGRASSARRCVASCPSRSPASSGLAVRLPFLVGTALELQVVEDDRRHVVAARAQRDDAWLLALQDRRHHQAWPYDCHFS